MKEFSKRLKTALRLLITVCLFFTICFSNADVFVSGLNALDRNHYASAYRSFKPLAEQGAAEAQNNLGFLFQNGFGVRRNYNTAIQWYQRAADQGLAEAEHNLGVLNYRGHGVAQSYSVARRWFNRAAKKGLNDSHYMIGLMFYKGEGTVASLERASQHFSIAAKSGDANSQYMLAHMILTGDAENPYKPKSKDSSPFDFSIFESESLNAIIASLSLALLASQNGQELAVQLVDFAKSQLEPEEIAVSEELAEVCISSDYKNCPIFSIPG